MKKTVALILALVMCIGMLCSCTSDKKNTAMSIKDGGKLSINFMYLLTALQKSMYSEVIASYGADWNTVVDEETGETFSDLVYEQVIKSAESSLICEYLHDKVYGLTLTDTQKQSIDAQISSLSETAGSKQNLEAQLSSYSADIATLKRYLEISLKQNNLYNLFYDTDGIYAVSEDSAKKYFEDNYSIVTHIYFNTSSKVKEDGTLVSMPEEEQAQKRQLAENVYSSILAGEDFYALKDRYSEDAYESTYYPNGFFVTGDTSFPTEFTVAALEMKVGEYRMVETSGTGIHIMYKLPMNPALYNTDETVYNTIMSMLISEDFDLRLAEYAQNIEVNDEQMALLNIEIIPEYGIE